VFLEFFISLEGFFAEQIMRYIDEPFCQWLNPTPIIQLQCRFIDGFSLRHHVNHTATSVLRQLFCEFPNVIGESNGGLPPSKLP